MTRHLLAQLNENQIQDRTSAEYCEAGLDPINPGVSQIIHDERSWWNKKMCTTTTSFPLEENSIPSSLSSSQFFFREGKRSEKTMTPPSTRRDSELMIN